MRKASLGALIGVAVISALFGIATALVGQLPSNCDVPYSGWLPVTTLVVTLLPFVCGYFAGMHDYKPVDRMSSSEYESESYIENIERLQDF